MSNNTNLINNSNSSLVSTSTPSAQHIESSLNSCRTTDFSRSNNCKENYLSPGEIHLGDAADLIWKIEPETIDLSVWSPPYHVGKNYEKGQSLEDWENLLRKVIKGHLQALKPGAFCVINISDILAFPDVTMPRIQADTHNSRKLPLTKEQIIAAIEELGTTKRKVLGEYFGVSEQTIDRRLNGNNIRGGKYQTQTRVFPVAGMIEDMSKEAGLYLYDRRIWVKDPAWANSRWASSSFRAVDEFEYLFFLWKPGVTKVRRDRLSNKEWSEWGSRAVWNIRSVRANDNHEAKFPIELPARLIKLLTDRGDTVLDPFSGSGTTQVAAVQQGRVPMGFELNEDYWSFARNAMNNTQQFIL